MATVKHYCLGTHRYCPPQVTLDRIAPYMDAFGITRVANVTGLDRLGIPVAMVCRPNSRSLSVFQGKGLTYEAAQVSGIMEAIECFHAEMIERPSLSESFNRLQPGNRARLEKISRLKGHSFDPETKMTWMHGHDLFGGGDKLLPYQCVHMNCTIQGATEEQVFISDTNGLASGNTAIEAVNHGLCEVIERDALALWSFTDPVARKNRKIRLKDIPDGFVQTFLARCNDADVAVAAWDITTDLGLPSFICKVMSLDQAHSGIRPAYGSGTHLSRLVALQRAMTEAAQSRITFIAGARDDQYAPFYASQLSPAAHQRWYSDIVQQEETASFEAVPDFATDSFEDDQRIILGKLADQDLDEAIAIDLTRPEYGIAVSKIIVPGLEGTSFSGMRVVGDRGRQYMATQGGA